MLKIFLLLTIVCFFLISAVPTLAFVDFGGTVSMRKSCVNGILFYITPAGGFISKGPYIFKWGVSSLKKWWQLPRHGLKVLGKAIPFGVCTQVESPPIPASTVLFMGTSR
jgi:hypothetical protein